jgi:hypothetical protein
MLPGTVSANRAAVLASAQQAKCLAGKTSCMAKQAAGLLKCEALAEKLEWSRWESNPRPLECHAEAGVYGRCATVRNRARNRAPPVALRLVARRRGRFVPHNTRPAHWLRPWLGSSLRKCGGLVAAPAKRVVAAKGNPTF